MAISPDDTSISEAQFNAYFTPKQILFLSADLVGSTALKQKKRQKFNQNGVLMPDTTDWANAIQVFYSSLTDNFEKAWTKRIGKFAKKRREQIMGAPPILWKTIGDELIFRKHISRKDQVFEIVHCFVESVKNTTSQIRKEIENEQLEIKCTAWIAEFPIQNKVLVGGQFADIAKINPKNRGNLLRTLENYEKNAIGGGLEIDFVGPAIDIGFRLAKLSSSRKFIMSLDTAYLYLTYSRYNEAAESKAHPLHFERPVRLDGVMGGVPYPIFWIDLGEVDSTDRLEDKLLKPGTQEHRTDATDAITFCNAFYTERRNYVDPPFIYEEAEELADDERKPPEWHAAMIESYRSDYIIYSDEKD
jgi:hypothetical protein